MGLGKRQLALLLGRYKFFVITVVFFLVLWVGFSGSTEKIEESSVPLRQLAVKEEKKVKEIPDFDYKYDDDKKHNQISALEDNKIDRNVKESVHNYIQNHKEKIKSVNENLRDALLLSNSLDPELPIRDFKNEIIQPAKPTRRKHNSLNGVNIANEDTVENRMQFKEEHQCKPFSWFLENIYPEKFILDDPQHVFAYGRLRNPSSTTCLDNLQNDKDSYDLG